MKSEEERMRNCLSPRKKRERMSMNEKEQEKGKDQKIMQNIS